MTDPATLLGVERGADADSIRAAFAHQMRAVHPDTAGASAVAEEVSALIAARDHLLRREDPPGRPGGVVFYQRRRLADRLVPFRRQRRRTRVLL